MHFVLVYIWFALKVPSIDPLGLNICSTLGNDIPKVSRSTSSTVSTAIIVNWFLNSGTSFRSIKLSFGIKTDFYLPLSSK